MKGRDLDEAIRRVVAEAGVVVYDRAEEARARRLAAGVPLGGFAARLFEAEPRWEDLELRVNGEPFDLVFVPYRKARGGLVGAVRDSRSNV